MTFMPWTDELALGIEEIDRQHQWLVHLTNRLHDEVSQPHPDRQRLGEILEGLVDYTHNHFIVEEAAFQQHHYPDTDAHMDEHNRFTRKATQLLMRFEAGDEVNLETLEFLKEWLLHHICKVDRAYLPFMHSVLEQSPHMLPSMET